MSPICNMSASAAIPGAECEATGAGRGACKSTPRRSARRTASNEKRAPSGRNTLHASSTKRVESPPWLTNTLRLRMLANISSAATLAMRVRHPTANAANTAIAATKKPRTAIGSSMKSSSERAVSYFAGSEPAGSTPYAV